MYGFIIYLLKNVKLFQKYELLRKTLIHPFLVDSTFVPAKMCAKASRKYFTAPAVPTGWRPNPNRIKSLLERKTPHKMSDSLLKASERLTPFQRAKLLGERDHSVLEMLSSADREKLRQLTGGKGSEKADNQRRQRNEAAEPFEEEPMKAHRFKKFVAYLKRGFYFYFEKIY